MYDVNEVLRLSQDEGLNDRQIGEIMGCSRTTINRIRNRNNIPRCQSRNRLDKTYVCLNCGAEVTIRRKERRQAFCPKCKASINNINNTK